MSSAVATLVSTPTHNKVAPTQLPLQLSVDSVHQSLTRWLPGRSSDEEWWWKAMGPHLETLLCGAGYSFADQSEALLFFYHWIAPRLGPRPKSKDAAWKSFMTDDYTPIEYSWKWGHGDITPEVRYSIELISHQAGSVRDPHNQAATVEFLDRLGRSGHSGLNLVWFNHFKHALLGPGTPASKAGVDKSQTTLFVAFELARGGPPGVKAYFIPVSIPGNSASQQISAAIATAGCPNLTAIDELHNFLQNDPHGCTISSFMLGIDCISPLESRLKIYARSRCTSFEFVRHIMSLGGRIRGIEEAEKQLAWVWKLTLGLDEDFPDDRELTVRSHKTAGILFYFDVGPKMKLPDVKLYIPVRHYAPSDKVSAEGLVKFLESQGSGKYTKNYMETLEAVAPKGGLANANGVQTYITCAYKKGKLVVTSYLNPQLYHPSFHG